MINRYPKGADVQLSRNFHLRDFDCRCKYSDCSVTYVEEELVLAFEEVLAKCPAGTRHQVDSGFRCTRHNEDVKGKVGSFHLTGKAGDLKVFGLSGGEVAALAEEIPVFKKGGVGIYDRFAHLDTRGYRARWRG